MESLLQEIAMAVAFDRVPERDAELDDDLIEQAILAEIEVMAEELKLFDGPEEDMRPIDAMNIWMRGGGP